MESAFMEISLYLQRFIIGRQLLQPHPEDVAPIRKLAIDFGDQRRDCRVELPDATNTRDKFCQ